MIDSRNWFNAPIDSLSRRRICRLMGQYYRQSVLQLICVKNEKTESRLSKEERDYFIPFAVISRIIGKSPAGFLIGYSSKPE
jgi:hypothetical protein